MQRISIAIMALAAVFAMPAAHAQAQANFPSRVVKLVVPYPPGGGTDLLARVLADRLSHKWDQSVIIENVGGAGGNIGGAEVFRADPDGYTLLLASPGPIALNDFSFKDMSYDPTKWVPIALLATSPYVLVLSPEFPASSVQDVVARARAEPGKLIVATPGLGSVGHFATIELEMLAHIDLLQVPYKGLGPAVSDVVAGHVNMMFDMLATSLPLHQAGKEKIVAVGGGERVAALPDVPTLAEAGIAGFRAVTFFGIVAPPGTADALADKINRDVGDCLREAEFIEKTKVLGMDLAPRSRAETAKFFADERELWGKVIKSANIPMQ